MGREPSDHHRAPPDPEIERNEEVRSSLAQHIAPADPQIRRAVLHVRGYVIRLEQQEAKGTHIPYERAVIVTERARVDASP
jgi:hypothetical protein